MPWRQVGYRGEQGDVPGTLQNPGVWDRAERGVFQETRSFHTADIETDEVNAFQTLLYTLVREHAHRRRYLVAEDGDHILLHLEDKPGEERRAELDYDLSWSHVFTVRPDGPLQSKMTVRHDVEEKEDVDLDHAQYAVRRHAYIRRKIFNAIVGRAAHLTRLYEDLETFAEEYGDDITENTLDVFREHGPPVDGEWDLEESSRRRVEHFHLPEEAVWTYEQEEDYDALHSIWEEGINTIESLLSGNREA